MKKPEWEWFVPAYFLVGGTASGAYITATLADIVGRRSDRPYVVAGRLIALLGVLASLPLLVADLGRPERFLNMLRVFKPRSMMSTGSWALTIFGGFAGLGVGVEVLRLLSPRWPLLRVLVLPLRVLSWLGALPAINVITAVLAYGLARGGNANLSDLAIVSLVATCLMIFPASIK